MARHDDKSYKPPPPAIDYTAVLREKPNDSKPLAKQPKKNKTLPILDFTAVYWDKTQVCHFLGWSAAKLGRKIKEQGFPPGRHGPLPSSWTDKHGRKISPRRPNDK